MTELLPCDCCGRLTPIDLLDGKDDGSGDFNILECKPCYGPGWRPTGRLPLGWAVRFFFRWLRLKPLRASHGFAWDEDEPPQSMERVDNDTQYLHEVADGAYGDDPATRGRARDLLRKMGEERP